MFDYFVKHLLYFIKRKHILNRCWNFQRKIFSSLILFFSYVGTGLPGLNQY